MLRFPDLDGESKGISWIQSNPFDMQCTPVMTEQTTDTSPTPPPDLKYSLVKGGHDCNRVTTVAECENAAKLLGLVDLEAQELPLDHEQALRRPPYCYYNTGDHEGLRDHEGLKFNPTEGITTEMTACSELRPCICHTDGAMTEQTTAASPDLKYSPVTDGWSRSQPMGKYGWVQSSFFTYIHKSTNLDEAYLGCYDDEDRIWPSDPGTVTALNEINSPAK